MPALYNEIEPFACDWLVNLEQAGHIAPGRVLRRSIRELLAADVAGAGQRHFFAGIGVWSHALLLAGWPDDLGVWTGSCPCQPFSSAGRKAGFDDERHLWPAWFRLIRECRPAVVFGEQVASADARTWVDLVRADLEGAGYAFGVANLCAGGVGAPHIRQRLYFVALADGERLEGVRIHLRERRSRQALSQAPWCGEVGQLADDRERRCDIERRSAGCEAGARLRGDQPDNGSAARGMRRTVGDGLEGRGEAWPASRPIVGSGATSGFWSPCDWIPCRDGKLRPVEPGTFPLAHGAAARVGRLRAYGNAITAQAAAVFIQAVMEILAS